MKTVDTDKNGTINLNEAKSAAAAVIVKIDVDHNGILDQKELGERYTTLQTMLPSPNPFMFWKSKATVTKEDYLSLVETRFKAADPDKDGTLDAKELATESGQELLKLVQ
jgi:Ca2+-binding EF-hand superfamily protein